MLPRSLSFPSNYDVLRTRTPALAVVIVPLHILIRPSVPDLLRGQASLSHKSIPTTN